MDNKTILLKCLTLLFRESEMSNHEDNSVDLVREVLEDVKINELNLGGQSDKNMLLGIKELVLELLEHPNDLYDKTLLIQRLQLLTLEDERFFDVIKSGLEADLEPDKLKKTILTIRRVLNNHLREKRISDYLNNSSYKLKFKRDEIKDMNEFILNLTKELDTLQTGNDGTDTSIIGETSLSDPSSITKVLKEIKESNNGEGILKTGWQALNRMLQGGFRRGEFTMISALQHKYKSGFTLSLLCQLAMYNTPYMLDKSKKPALLRISFEDDLTGNYEFIYKYLKYNENGVLPDVKNDSPEYMQQYIYSKLSVNGYEVFMMRVNPVNWTYKHIINKILELESQGYEIHMAMVDYLSMVPTVGCNTNGPMGTDLRDMFRRIRNFCSAKKISFITPHQLSTEAKELVRNGNNSFVKFIAEKGYYSGSKQLDQEVDLELYIHIEKQDGDSFLTVQRGKHRDTGIISDDMKYFVLKFPKRSPIPDDLLKQDSSLRRVGGSPNEETNDELFSLKKSMQI
jgi:hypothetical protein